MDLKVQPAGQACGAHVTGLDLKARLDPEQVAQIRAAWLEHHVLAFPDQFLSDDDLERFTLAMGGFGEDPFFAPIPGREHIAAIRREANEQSPLFAENWHTDWSFRNFRLLAPVSTRSIFRRMAAIRCLPTSIWPGRR